MQLLAHVNITAVDILDGLDAGTNSSHLIVRKLRHRCDDFRLEVLAESCIEKLQSLRLLYFNNSTMLTARSFDKVKKMYFRVVLDAVLAYVATLLKSRQ